MKIKICGLSRLEDIDYINEGMPDYAGFIFAENSKRKVDIDTSLKLRNNLNRKIETVGVFVNQKISFIKEIVDLKIIDYIQLHGKEDNDYINILKRQTKLPIIKAFKAVDNLKEIIEQSSSDYVLIDSYNKDSFGGTGNTFDWGIIPKTTKKIFLAGGLNIENVEDAIKKVNPYCLDINSGVETDGKKDKKKILDIIKIIKGYKNE